MTVPENCALKLLRLLAAPGKSIPKTHFYGRDASGNTYTSLFESLERQGKIKLNYTTITLIEESV